MQLPEKSSLVFFRHGGGGGGGGGCHTPIIVGNIFQVNVR
jgi:hypothetical protein